ncbi:MAG: hypothetical protein V4714_18260, partial [Bacteroidota bacterium]
IFNSSHCNSAVVLNLPFITRDNRKDKNKAKPSFISTNREINPKHCKKTIKPLELSISSHQFCGLQ